MINMGSKESMEVTLLEVYLMTLGLLGLDSVEAMVIHILHTPLTSHSREQRIYSRTFLGEMIHLLDSWMMMKMISLEDLDLDMARGRREARNQATMMISLVEDSVWEVAWVEDLGKWASLISTQVLTICSPEDLKEWEEAWPMPPVLNRPPLLSKHSTLSLTHLYRNGKKVTRIEKTFTDQEGN